MKRFITSKILFFYIAVGTCFPVSGQAYSVLSHEAIIDATWKSSIKPLLKKKYPGATEQQLKEAHAYVYGGSIIPDLGYFPFGSTLFTNLVHYVRSGDFVNTLLDEAQNIDEYAFALGMLCHYIADNYGHPLGTNRSVPILFPKLEKKYGHVVTYHQNHIAHLRTEFGFDVLQVEQSDYKTIAYHDFIGFKVADTLLQRAFLKTYGLNVKDIFVSYNKALGTFRWAVKNLFPELTKDAWKMKRTYFLKANPYANLTNFVNPKTYVYNMDKKSYYKEFGKQRKKSGPISLLLSFLIRVVPKVGPMKMMKFTMPAPEVVQLYKNSMDTAIMEYKIALKKLDARKPNFKNMDYDTGNKTKPGEYPPTDETYCTLVLDLKNQNFNTVNPELRKNILAFFADENKLHIKKDSHTLKKVNASLEELKLVAVN